MAALEQQALVASERDNMRLRTRLEKFAKENKNQIKTATNAVVTIGAAGALAYLEARYPERMQISGFDASLLVGGAALVAGAMGWTGEDELVMAAGTGALAAYAAKRGSKSGAEAKAEDEKKK